MSETLESVAEVPVEPSEPVETPVAETAPETPVQAEPEVPPKPKGGDRRYAALTAKLSAEGNRANQLERQLADALAKLSPADPQANAGETVEQAAQRILTQREFESKQQALVAEGYREFGAEEWNEKTGFLHNMGATQNPSFMAALVELNAGPKLVMHLADDPDALTALLAKSPVAMAASLGRMAAELSRPAPKAAVSNAPRPAAPVKPATVVPEPTAYDDNLTMAEYAALRAKTAPPHLRGIVRR